MLAVDAEAVPPLSLLDRQEGGTVADPVAGWPVHFWQKVDAFLCLVVGAGTTFCGHTGALTSVGWSHSGDLVITAAADRCRGHRGAVPGGGGGCN
jgi:hypothetical protein